MPNPNTNFSNGAVLTAAQQNRFPRGVMTLTYQTNSDATITAEEVQITGPSFTAISNRYYRVTYYEPYLSANASTIFTMRIRLGNIAGGIWQTNNVINTIGNVFFGTSGISQALVSGISGTQNFVGTLAASSGTGNASRSGTQYGFLLVEDIGPT